MPPKYQDLVDYLKELPAEFRDQLGTDVPVIIRTFIERNNIRSGQYKVGQKACYAAFKRWCTIFRLYYTPTRTEFWEAFAPNFPTKGTAVFLFVDARGLKVVTAPSKFKRYGLARPTFRPSVREYLDYDYLDKLPLAEKEWLKKFNEEYYNRRFSYDDTFDLHSPHEKRLEVFKENNARQNDAMSYAREGRRLLSATPAMADMGFCGASTKEQVEDALAEYVDSRRPTQDDPGGASEDESDD